MFPKIRSLRTRDGFYQPNLRFTGDDNDLHLLSDWHVYDYRRRRRRRIT